MNEISNYDLVKRIRGVRTNLYQKNDSVVLNRRHVLVTVDNFYIFASLMGIDVDSSSENIILPQEVVNISMKTSY